MSLAIRDRIIQTYKKEIESHKLNERNFSSIVARIEDLKRRRDGMESSIETLRSDYEAQLVSQQKVMDSLNNELNLLKRQNDDKQQEAHEIQD